jgi:hypothetical protein
MLKSAPFIALSLFTVAALASAQEERASDRKMAEDLYAKCDAEIRSGNISAFLTHFSPGFYYVDANGKRTDFAQFKAELVGMVKAMKGMKEETRIKNVQLQNDELVVWVEMTFTYKVKHGTKWVTEAHKARSADSLARKNGSWVFTSSQELMTNEPWSFKTTR